MLIILPASTVPLQGPGFLLSDPFPSPAPGVRRVRKPFFASGLGD